MTTHSLLPSAAYDGSGERFAERKLDRIVRYRYEYLSGDEKGEGQENEVPASPGLAGKDLTRERCR